MSETTYKWGIDLGGTKIEGAVLNEKLEPIVRERIATEGDHGYEHVIKRIGTLVDQIAEKVGDRPGALGIGTPGSLDPQTGLLKNSNTTSLNGKPFLKDLIGELGMEVKIANDANCFALAEATMGVVPDEVPDAEVVFGVIMGTGCGGGVVVNGKAINGRHGIGGEWGHTQLNPDGHQCYCGDYGCAELYLSGAHTEKYYEKESGTFVKLRELADRYGKGTDPIADKTIDRLLGYFGVGLANVINVIDPDVIVLGGGVSNLDLLYTKGVEAVERHVFNPTFSTPILRPKLGDSAGVFGAALL